jgi:hypothetical protein
MKNSQKRSPLNAVDETLKRILNVNTFPRAGRYEWTWMRYFSLQWRAIVREKGSVISAQWQIRSAVIWRNRRAESLGGEWKRILP